MPAAPAATRALACALLAALAATPGARREGAGDGAGPRPEPIFHATEGIAATFGELASARPEWFRATTLGESVQGRPIPLLAVSDFGVDDPKVGMWVDGAIHGFELASAEPALGLAERVAAEIEAGRPPAFLGRVVLYLVPVLNVDGRQLATTPPFVRQRENLQPVDDDGDGVFDEDGPADLDGDGVASLFESGAGWTYEAGDQDGDGACGEDPPGGIDLNRNFPVARGPDDRPATPLQPETRAVVEFWLAHPEIELAVSYHTSADGCVLPPVRIEEPDRAAYERIVAVYAEGTGHGPLDLRPWSEYRGTTCDWFYGERGAIALIIEMSTDVSPAPPLEFVTVPTDCFGPRRMPRLAPGSPAGAAAPWLRGITAERRARHVDVLMEMAAALPLRREGEGR